MWERVADSWPRSGSVHNYAVCWSQILASERAVAEASQSATVDAHVVAPCPHDGGCPMDGTRAWCHFVQRFERGRLQQQVKALPGATLWGLMKIQNGVCSPCSDASGALVCQASPRLGSVALNIALN